MIKRNEELQKLGEARNLLDMLDYVFGGLSADAVERRGGPPWGGMKITLEHINRRLLELEEMLRQTPAGSDAHAPIAPAAVSEAAVSGGIAGRIQMAPRAGRRGYSRELASGEPIGAQESARVE